MTGNFPRRPLGTPHVPGDGIITPGDPSFGLPFDITSVMCGRACDGGIIPQFERHLTKQDPSSEHIRHLAPGRIRIQIRTLLSSQSTKPRFEPGKLTVKVYSPSSGRSNNLTRFSPSIIVATEFPKNFDFGFSSPVMRTPFLGDV
jgi:hypothetical protein